ncbi:MAG: MraY family glycosyltransferase [Mariprofundus sp.]|nr:MraY family glycosyltransferase [Mariprofundus sp.]
MFQQGGAIPDDADFFDFRTKGAGSVVVTYGLMLVTALMVTLVILPLTIRFAHELGMVDVPDARKTHLIHMPRSGGVGIALGFFFSILLFGTSDQGVQAVMLGALVIIATGVLDDIWQIRPLHKFIGQIIAAVLFIWWSGVSLTSIGDIFGVGPIHTGPFGFAFTVLCIVGVINALNLSDGLDGLAGGMSVIACLFLGFFAYVSQQWASLFIVVALFGSLLGFLYYNSHPAKVFMGDTGSLLLGYLLVTAEILLAGGKGAVVFPVTMALVLALPVVDTALVMTHRIMRGSSPFSPDRTHIHHRLLDLGLPHGAVVSLLYATMGLYGLVAVLLRDQAEWVQFATGAAIAFTIYGVVNVLEKAGYRWGEAADAVEDVDASLPSVLYQRITAWSGQSIPWVTWLIPVLLLLPAIYLDPLSTKAAWLTLFSVGGLLVLYPIFSYEDREGLAHAILYWSIFLILAACTCYGNDQVRLYLAVISSLVAIWVVVKLVFKRHRRIFLTSGFEVLIILVSWLIPQLLEHASYISAERKDWLMLVCLESIPFLLAMKIIIRKQAHRNRSLVLSLSTILIVLAVNGFI